MTKRTKIEQSSTLAKRKADRIQAEFGAAFDGIRGASVTEKLNEFGFEAARENMFCMEADAWGQRLEWLERQRDALAKDIVATSGQPDSEIKSSTLARLEARFGGVLAEIEVIAPLFEVAKLAAEIGLGKKYRSRKARYTERAGSAAMKKDASEKLRALAAKYA